MGVVGPCGSVRGDVAGLAMRTVDKSGFLKRYAVIVVTGGSSGIGAEFLKAFSKLTPEAVVCNLSRSRPADFTESGQRVHIACDLEKIDELQRAAGQVLEVIGEASSPGGVLLVNNSGFGLYGEFPEDAPEKIAAMTDLNCRAPVLLTALLWPELLRRGGAVLNVASLAAFQPTPFLSTYAATKAFLLNWSVALDAEGRRHGVRALALCPGPTPTNFFRRAGFGERPVPGYGTTTEHVVADALKALARGDAKIVPGLPNKLVAFLTPMLPRRFTAWAGYRLMARMRLKPLREKTK